MKVFISWSGPASQKVAEELRPWLPKVIQRLSPYVSSEDIYVGERWLNDISAELESASCGILCLTKENVNAPWLNFEAGALSKAIDKARIIPFMFDLKPSDLPANSPLNQFQATRQYNKDELCKLVKSLNDVSGSEKLPESLLDQTFEIWWPELKKKLDVIEKECRTSTVSKSQEKRGSPEEKNSEILEEILQHSRRQIKMSKGLPEKALDRYNMLHSEMERILYELHEAYQAGYITPFGDRAVNAHSAFGAHTALGKVGHLHFDVEAMEQNVRKLLDISKEMKYTIAHYSF